MAKAKSKVKEVDEVGEETPAKEPKGKYYDVLDVNGDLLNIYSDKKVADEFAKKNINRKVVVSPPSRKREDVRDAGLAKQQKRLEQLVNNADVLDKF